MTTLAVVIFVLTYAGVAIGDIPGLKLDRTGIALLGAIGSIANLIVIEQAKRYGVEITFAEHARIGIPVTLLSLAVLVGWIYVT